ncbi:hypothetical protein ACOJBM_20290 [Rhizobium beringeri]|jgi:hypothetical protein|uniref:Uncharacterized protein n=2 Tax=Rhizobium TaxID=379 RepID=A0A444HSJ2_RHILE|nr:MULTISPECIES: hypothetical protein [Rhizobium]MBY5458869.1 hypothetical protein [Rhizobium leguminosarum]NKL60462.1 hypothetical protein [Rhizobium leguminosarum bv. viciae]RWX13495.1 hypothetical protein EHI45_14585 [Rhizobium leguminosarum]RWX26039.1 hypothetical protein EHI47_24850 [Rhizobium leguminosarum]TAU52133.1 hypothetical protein ELI43_04555 [Rhizobium leguminosarum]
MSLLKFFLRPALPARSAEIIPTWKDDPLRHPEVERMSMREIADLPLGMPTGFPKEAKPPLAKCA